MKIGSSCQAFEIKPTGKMLKNILKITTITILTNFIERELIKMDSKRYAGRKSIF